MTQTQAGASELELTRVPGDRRRYALAGVGSLRLEGLLSRSATAEAVDGARWKLGRRGFWQREITAVDQVGAVDGEFFPRTIRRGGLLRWRDRELTLAPASSWRERYVLAEGDRVLALLEGKAWGRRPVKITIGETEAIEPGLLLFAAFVVRGLADDASGASGAGASAAAYT